MGRGRVCHAACLVTHPSMSRRVTHSARPPRATARLKKLPNGLRVFDLPKDSPRITTQQVKRLELHRLMPPMRMRNPPHPGDFIRTEIIEPRGLSVTSAAQVLRVARPTLSSLLNGKANLSGQLALRIEKAFGVKMDTLMRMQAAYDIAEARKAEARIRVQRYQPGPAHA